MKKRLTTLLALCLMATLSFAQAVSVKWEFSDANNLSAVTMSGNTAYTSLLTTNYVQGSYLATNSTMTSSVADTGQTPATYSPAFTKFRPSASVTAKTNGHSLAFGVTPASGHKLKVTKIAFDAAKCGTDKGGIIVTVKPSGGTETQLESITPGRNKVVNAGDIAYSHHEITVSDFVVDSKMAVINLYVVNIATDKDMAFRNIEVFGVLDEEVFTASHYLTNLTFNGKTGSDAASHINLYDLIKNLKNGDNVRYSTKLFADPTDFAATLASGLAAGHTADVTYNATSHKASISIKQDGKEVFAFSVTFTVSSAQATKPAAKPLKRGLMAVLNGSKALVSWRARSTDSNLKFYLYKGSTISGITNKVNSGNAIIGKTNFEDSGANASTYYRLDVRDASGKVIESETCKIWNSQTMYITLEGGAPTDPTSAKATYTPNDASYCDMDGDGEYEIILKWAPSNEKDAASDGVTSPAFYGCYKMSGKRLWLLHTGANMFNSAHTTPFIAWDLDGDGYGEFMVKTAPGAVDGEGNYVLLGNDDPTANLKSGRGKQDHGSEYITVFDGTTGVELKTIPYHTDYQTGLSYWGDKDGKQNRSERYLAALAYLDGIDSNPSAIFARGYYSGAFVGAYDWDGENLTPRWVHRAYSATNGKVEYADGTSKSLTSTVYGEGAHWISVADCNGDGKQDIVFGSGALKHDGTTLYRTGWGHGDALHVSDFDPSNPGLEVYMSHEHSPYGADLRDAATGKQLIRHTAGSDTGRGLIAHFNPEADGAYFQHSASTAIYDWKGNIVNESITHGGGASLNNRIYWNGTLADDFYDKSVLEYWNPEANEFWRMSVNGGNYTIGTLNNSTKYNPCVLGDFLGDWREEIINWTGDAASGFQLVVNATNYPTDYTVPHLMENHAYRAQVVNQNCAYNQPPHLDYDLRNSKIITRKPIAVEPSKGITASAAKYGKYWDAFFTSYPVKIPANVTAWSYSNVDTKTDTLKLTKLDAGDIIPANTSIIYNSSVPDPKFVPTSLAATASIATSNVLRGSCNDSTIVKESLYNTYEFRTGKQGLGFYLATGKTIKAGNAFLRNFTFTLKADSYILGPELQPMLPLAAIKGDADDDGVVTMADAKLTLDYVIGKNPQNINLDNADIDDNGEVTMHDANAIVNIYLNSQK